MIYTTVTEGPANITNRYPATAYVEYLFTERIKLFRIEPGREDEFVIDLDDLEATPGRGPGRSGPGTLSTARVATGAGGAIAIGPGGLLPADDTDTGITPPLAGPLSLNAFI